MSKLTPRKIKSIMQEIEETLLTQDKIEFTFDRKWSSNFPDAPGIYTIFDNNSLVYIGESANVKERMKEIKRTVNHTFRKKLCRKLHGKQPIEKSRYPSKIEKALDEYYKKNLTFSAVELQFGRLETETYLINKYKDEGILNSIGKRE